MTQIYITLSHKICHVYMLIQINRSQHAFQFLGTFKLILLQSSLHHPYMLPSSCTLTSPSLLSYHYYYLHLITITIITISLIITISIITITIIITPTFIVYNHKIKVPSIKIGDVTISALESCRNLGIIFDSTMSMSAHISSVCKSVRYYLRNLGIIRKYLTRSATEKIVHAFISSRLDFGNAHFFQLPQSQLTRLQRLQNAAARLIMLSKLKDHNHTNPLFSSLAPC